MNSHSILSSPYLSLPCVGVSGLHLWHLMAEWLGWASGGHGFDSWVGSNLECIVLLSKSYFNQKYLVHISWHLVYLHSGQIWNDRLVKADDKPRYEIGWWVLQYYWDSLWKRERREKGRGGEEGEGLGLGCLITPGLSKDIPCHVWPYLF